MGLLIGATPLYGLHLVLVMGVCLPLKLDVPLAYLAANISNPFVAPFLLLAEIETGAMARAGVWRDLSAEAVRQSGPAPYLADVVVGTLAFAPALALVGGAATYGAAALAQRLRRPRGAKA